MLGVVVCFLRAQDIIQNIVFVVVFDVCIIVLVVVNSVLLI